MLELLEVSCGAALVLLPWFKMSERASENRASSIKSILSAAQTLLLSFSSFLSASIFVYSRYCCCGLNQLDSASEDLRDLEALAPLP